MPIYTFRCTQCGIIVEEDQQISSTTSELYRLCTCNSNLHLFKKVFTPIPVHFKGKWNDKN